MRDTRPSLRLACLLTTCVMALGAAAAGCSGGDAGDAGEPEPIINETFTFASPGGQLEITYPEEERKPVADFSGPSLMEPDTTLSLSDFDGQVVVLTAWGQWCGPCRTEIDDLENIQEEISPRGGTVLGINVRDANQQIARDFITDNGATYPSIWDPPFKTAAALGGVPASVIPTTVVLDRDHRVAAVFLRAITDREVLEVVEPLLEESR
ncbi:TlpA disulfide reductase family protein [Corynebacterium mendelii]|uniref:TlpA family protein disulfide reductase n=1 Tax=Corynebacterium mendelii TaxID=2765362 RepID=A0A939DZW9_9CORY|nr:TlpA disulfide reductase family protein [Corynebacterium mendelii]MBN9643889.1 TlpA family protein disulfide reductase [Corynebacterium mendelii]